MYTRGIALVALGLAWVAGPGDLRAEDAPLRLLPLTGRPRAVLVAEGDTLVDIAHHERVGFEPLARLNPDVKVWVPRPGTLVRLPTWQVLPDASLEGLVINVPEMRLYDYTATGGVAVHAVAVGDAVDPSPLGRFRVGAKAVHPVWNVPASIRLARPELPPQVLPGPENPLGSRWMRIGETSYGIHGTNLPWSIGRRSTHGCIRLYEPEMQELFERVAIGTAIELVYQTVKLGRRGEVLYAEVHPDLYGLAPDPERVARTLGRLEQAGLSDAVDTDALRRAIDEQRGIPVPIGRLERDQRVRAAALARDG